MSLELLSRPATSTQKPATDEPCSCPFAQHIHGTVDMYSTHRCRCTPCRKARSDYHYETTKFAPRVPRVDVAQVKARIKLLNAAGLSNLAISEMTGISSSAISGYANRSEDNRGKVLASTLDKLMDINSRRMKLRQVTPGTTVDGADSRTQIQDLHARGWCVEDVAARSGVHLQVLYRILRGYKTTETIRLKIEGGYLTLREMDPPTDTPLAVLRKERALKRAAENKWKVDMALSDHVFARSA